ncbi:MAG TPA: hypothetical protein VK689_10905, partial [Armatimonadota bacterium]|nr:hypothetical protein [Armatimonadota bacterium]
AGTVPPEGTGQPEGAMAAEEASQPEELEGSRGDTLGSGSESEDSPAWCPGWQKVADHVDELLLRLLSTAVTLPEFTALAEEEARKLLVQEGREGLRERQRRLQRRLAETKEQRRRLVDVYELGKLPLDEYVTRYDGIHARLQETEAELANVERRLSGQESDAALLQRIRELLTEVPVVWAALAPDERRQLVADLTEYVVVERTGYRQSRLRVKVHFLPEQSGLLPHAHSLNGGYAVGVDGLTERELALLYWLGQGRGIKEIAAHWNADSTGVYRLTRRIRERLQVETLEEAVALAWIRVQAEKERLPLDVATQRGLQPWRHSQASRMAHILEGYRRGLDRKAIAAEMGMALQSIRHYEWKACKQYGVKSLTEAVERFVEAQGITSEADGGAGA